MTNPDPDVQPSMANPTRHLDAGPEPEVPIAEVLSRLSVVVGGPLTEAIDDTIGRLILAGRPTAEQRHRIDTIRGSLYLASTALDDVLDAFNGEWPPPAEPTEGF